VGVIRFAIPLAAILIGVVALQARPDRDRTPSTPSATRPEASRAAGSHASGATEAPARGAEAAIPAAARPASSVPAGSAPIDRNAENCLFMVALLERELSLSPDQKALIGRVFQHRQGEIDAYHRQLKAAGAVSGEAYHRHMQELRGVAYRQVGMVLNSAQHARFMEMIARGSLNDVIMMDLDYAMVQVD
jgi:hypothetical protein